MTQGEQEGGYTELAEAFRYLDRLRESGVTNMYGARPYLIRDLGRSADQASDELSLWMKTFSRDEEPEARARSALSKATTQTQKAEG